MLVIYSFSHSSFLWERKGLEKEAVESQGFEGRFVQSLEFKAKESDFIYRHREPLNDLNRE